MTLTQIWPPPVEPRYLSRQVWDAETARSIPGVGRALGVYGMASQCALVEFRGGVQSKTRPRMLTAPDPLWSLPRWLQVHIEDYLLHGNSLHLVTAWDAEGYPAAAAWYPAGAWGVTDAGDGTPAYWLRGRRVPSSAVVHVARGAHSSEPFRGVGVVEQHLQSLDLAGLQSAAAAANMRERGLPAVAIITPNREHDPDAADAVATEWKKRFGSPDPKPAIFPSGTEIKPLSWNPTDLQMVEARAMSLKDTANAFNLDGYWLGAEGSSHTYRTPGPMFLALMRTSLSPVLAALAAGWSGQWLPRGREVRFDLRALLTDDLATMVQTFRSGVAGGLFDVDEARDYMGFPPMEPKPEPAAAPAPVDDTTPPPADTQEETSNDENHPGDR